jgi:geranylgeranyl diphosphate synthase type I
MRAIIRDSGALDRTEERIAMLTDAALEALADAEFVGEAREVLRDLAGAATQRRY